MKFPSPEFDDAVAALCHGAVSDNVLAELHERLRTDTAARDEYLWQVELHGELASGRPALSQGMDSDQLLENPLADDSPGRHVMGTGSFHHFQTALNIALLLMLMLGGGLWWSFTSLESSAPIEPVARITELENCHWVASTMEFHSGDSINSGQRLQLLSGTVELQFTSGARMRVLGPSILDPLADNSAFLMQGQIQLVAETPESRGFTVLTPTSKFVDIGTAFTATVEPDGLSRLDVSQGEVDVVLEGIESSPRLRAGETLCIEPGERGVMTRIEQGDGTAAFRFPTIAPPSSEDYADQTLGHASIRVSQGRLKTLRGHTGSADVLLDGAGQSHQDAPEESAFFEDGTNGSFLVDLGQVISVTKINSYSWHQHATLEEHRHRALQRFTLYGFAGDQLPDLTLAPHRAGWERIARVNTDSFFEVHEPLERPAQQACSMTATRGEIGRFRYLLWVTFGGTFFGEFDVLGSP